METFRFYRSTFALAARITVAGMLTFGACQLLGSNQSHWAVLTAIIVMESSLGGSLKSAFDRFVGSLGGALWGVSIMLLLPHNSIQDLCLALFAAIAPLALLVAWRPDYRVAPITAVILLLTPDVEGVGPLFPAGQRLIEIGIGSVVALAVAMFFLPARAHKVLGAAAGHALVLTADLLDSLAETLLGEPEPPTVASLHARIRRAISEAEAAAEEAVRERRNFLSNGPDPEPLCRTLRRLSHDLSSIGRAIAGRDPELACVGFDGATVEAAQAISAFLRGSGKAITDGAPAPSFDNVVDGLRRQGQAMAALRQSGALSELSGEAVTRIFSLAFSFQQLHRNLDDLANRVNELSSVSSIHSD
ncbi:MAG: FUSC family protein [Pseudorhizobium sp.]